ncbi:MAG: septal ring lytic transglycosylase RlpA family protein [Candidatus Binatia bacterium]
MLRKFFLWAAAMARRPSATIVFFFLTACSLPPGKIKTPIIPPSGVGVTQTGIASWYGPGFHGRPTASGAIYDQHELTAAHQTLPLGTRVMVTNLDNGRSIEVAINDRGPFAKGRIIDLSYAAAQTLGMIGRGTIPVRVEVLDSPVRINTIRQSLDYTLQVGSFTELENAQQLKNQLMQSHSEPSEISIALFHARETVYYRVQVGTFSNRNEAEGEARQLARKGFPVIIVEK